MVDSWQGISLSIDQYTALVELLPKIETALAARGVEVPRPEYNGRVSKDEKVQGGDDGDGGDDAEAEDDEERDGDDATASRKKAAGDKSRKNHEATSDEDER